MKKKFICRGSVVAENALNAIMEMIQTVELNSQPHEVIIQPHKKKRTLAQNNTLHMWFGEIASFSGHTPDDIKDDMKDRFYPKHTVPVLDRLVTVPISTTELTCVQMMDVMTQIQAMCAEFGIPITDPVPEEMRELASQALLEEAYRGPTPSSVHDDRRSDQGS